MSGAVNEEIAIWNAAFLTASRAIWAHAVREAVGEQKKGAPVHPEFVRASMVDDAVDYADRTRAAWKKRFLP